MSDDWDASDSDTAVTKTRSPPSAAPAPPARKAGKSKWDGEDEDDNGPVSDWEESSEEEAEAKPAPVAAPTKKKGTLKAKLAEKEALKAQKKNEDDDDMYDSDDVLDPREKAKLDRERELDADLNNAADLLGSAALGGTSSSELDALLSFNPKTKEQFVEFSNRIIQLVTKRLESKPLYPAFVEAHIKALAGPLTDVETRKAASGLTTLANEKQKEARDKSSGKKKKGVSKPGLGAVKGSTKMDTNAYEEALDDFGPDDFM